MHLRIALIAVACGVLFLSGCGGDGSIDTGDQATFTTQPLLTVTYF